jgi:hypothetical protein
MAQIGVLHRPGRAASSHADRRVVCWVALFGFAVVTALGLRAHTLWFDEMQAWNIARASASLPDLAANLRYEGHPVLWYLPLYVLTRVTGDPHSMQVLQWCIATSTAALVLFRAPFRVGLRVALLGGYFVAFEYGVISRSYGLGVLLLVTALVLLARPDPRWVGVTIALVGLALTSLPGAVVAIAVAVTVLLDPRLRRVPSARATGTAVIVAGLAAAVVCIPPDDFGALTPGLGDSSRFGTGLGVRVASSLSATWRALVPVPATAGEWNSNLLDRQPAAVWVEAALAVALFTLVLVVLRGFPFARRLWWVGSGGLFGFFVVVTRPEGARHAGFAFLLFVACAWCASAAPGASRPEAPPGDGRGLDTLLVAVLVTQVVAMLAVYPTASTQDFSRDRVLADAVHDAGLDDHIVSAQDWDGTTIGGYLDRRVYSLARGQPIMFLVTDVRQQRGMARLAAHGVGCVAAAIADRRDVPVALIVAGEVPGYRPLVVNDGASVYRIEPGSGADDCDSARRRTPARAEIPPST